MPIEIWASNLPNWRAEALSIAESVRTFSAILVENWYGCAKVCSVSLL